jgi:hypothetical protein
MGMSIKSLVEARWINRKWDLNIPSFKVDAAQLDIYVVQRGEDMRLDLVMKSMYDDIYTFAQADIILHINHIDNPLNIREGMVLYYPPSESLDDFRYYESGNVASNKSIKQRLGVLNKTTRTDEKRKKFLDANYSLPPVVLQENRAGVTVGVSTIKVGGL